MDNATVNIEDAKILLVDDQPANLDAAVRQAEIWVIGRAKHRWMGTFRRWPVCWGRVETEIIGF